MQATFQHFRSYFCGPISTHYGTTTAPFAKRRRKLILLLATALLSPLSAQAALPEAIQTALTRAALTSNDISIMITPVGDKSVSHLPPVVHVVDSRTQTSPIQLTDKVTKTTANKENSDDTDAIIIHKQQIKKQERQLQSATDDTYTYQSIESTPSLLPANDSLNDTDTATSTGTSSITAANKLKLSPLLSHQPEISRTPASTMKLIPSFVALDTLGADFVWYTRVYNTGIVIGNRLYGDLIIQGSGDPKMTHERLQQLLYQVQKKGIHHIEGDIIIDSSIFNNVSKNPGSFDNAPLRPYNASPDGFLVNFSTIGIQSYPLDNGQAQLTYTPRLANYQLPSIIDTRQAACSQASYSLAPQWQTDKLMLNAKLPESCGEYIFYVAYPDAKDFAARVLAEKWQQLGNTLSGKVIAQETPYNAHRFIKATKLRYGLAALPLSPLPIVSYPSFTLTQQIYDINHFSNNVMTEQLALSLGAYGKGDKQKPTTSTEQTTLQPTTNYINSLYQFGQPEPTDYPQALQAIDSWWKTHLTTPPPRLSNGSGLCRDCTVTAANLNELLTYAYSHPSFDAYVDSLGVAGVSGTIMHHSERLPESAAIGRAWIKTGTLNNVTSMAGYVKGQSGQDYVVVGLINTDQALNPYTARPVLDAMLDWTAQH